MDPMPKKVFALIRHTQEDIHASSSDGFQLPRIDKHIHMYMYTHPPASHMGRTCYTRSKTFRATRLQSLSKIKYVLPFHPSSMPGKVTVSYFPCLDLEDFASKL